MKGFFMKKRIFAALLSLMLVLSLSVAFAACGGNTGNECTHDDANTDGKCDKCEANVGECKHDDANTDGKCDKCGESVEAELKLVNGGKPTFSFVYSKDISSAAKTVASSTVRAINKVDRKSVV